ncbi:hydrogenase assembly chaperone [Stutzerimonas stutzeri]|uniref:HypC/HybG/HupF family hydrogenase formation chaperone n=1 Tax=Stutzerimonas stutzeri TaxID=316 RepID=UPI0024A46253|nr:HypC/HybG/HupF family hydrogenase formation chaperone [Stutzerimonas stutzeri]GLZ24119.1 hydrogenase assembly chaperone [Stutzerimonas stutzeri]
MCLAIPGRIVEIEGAGTGAIVEIAGVRRSVDISLIVRDGQPVAACLGEWVLVHVGFAMTRIDEAKAAEMIALLADLGEFR